MKFATIKKIMKSHSFFIIIFLRKPQIKIIKENYSRRLKIINKYSNRKNRRSIGQT